MGTKETTEVVFCGVANGSARTSQMREPLEWKEKKKKKRNGEIEKKEKGREEHGRK